MTKKINVFGRKPEGRRRSFGRSRSRRKDCIKLTLNQYVDGWTILKWILER
jgi:hypothetical protein